MTTTYSWAILIFVSLSFIASAQSCEWLHPNQEVLNREILRNFNQMTPTQVSSAVCLNSNFSLPDIKDLYDICKVESAAMIAVHEVANQILQFCGKYKEKLGYDCPSWKKLHGLLNYQKEQLSQPDCIPKGAENQLFIQGINQQFITLQRILDEQDNKVCAQKTALAEIRRNLLLTSQLSSRMRSQHLRRILS